MSAATLETTRVAPRLLSGIRNDRALTLDEHTNTFGALVRRRDLIDAVARSGLRGRGGAAFPTAKKLQAAAAQRLTPTVVVNAVEGEPASSKDRALMRLTPHLVLDGAALAADAVGADRIVVALAENARSERHALAQAIRERRAAFEIMSVPARFVAGEETALLHALEGGPAKPTLKPPYPFERGYLVQNAETLAQLAMVARHGRTTGTALLSLSGAVNKPGVHEIELGRTLSDVMHSLGGTSESVSAFLVAGYFGGWVPARDAPALTLTPDNLGAGVIVAHAARASGIAETARIARYLAGESAGQCGPCVNGLDAIAGALEDLARGDRAAASRLTRWTAHVRGRGACRHPDGAARLVESALEVFA